MRRFSVLWRRVAASSFLAALLVSGCQQSDLPSWGGGTKPDTVAEAPKPVVQAPPRPSQAPLPAPQPRVDVQALPMPPSQIGPGMAKEQVRAALLVPLSGQYEASGRAMSNAAQLAMFDVADERFNLIPIDTRGTAEGAAIATRQALAQGADIILGPLFSFEVRAAAPLAREASVPMVAFTTDRGAVGDGIYALGFLPDSQVRRVVAHARSEGRSRIALLAPANDYGRAIAEAMQAVAGANLVRSEFYDPSAHDHTQVVKRLTDYDRRRAGVEKDAPAAPPPFDAVMIPDAGTRLRAVAALLTYYEVDPTQVKFLGTLLWDDPRLAREAALEGGWYPAPPAADHQTFERRYAESFGPMPSLQAGALASLAYDAAALAAKLAGQGEGDYPPEALTNPNGFAGIDGIFRLLPSGANERGLAVREIARGGSREIAPAPTSFAQPGT